jgi:hypothetical protein
MSLEKIIASCKCGEQEIETEKLLNQFGYLDKVEWQCPKCWQMIMLEVRKPERKNANN